MRKIRGALIDLDGTLLDTAGDLAAAANRMLAALGRAPRTIPASWRASTRSPLMLRSIDTPADSVQPDFQAAPAGDTVLTVHAKTLQRAAEIVGGEQQLALHLKVTPSHLALWIQGIEQPPGDIFLKAVDLVVDNDVLSKLPSAARLPAEDNSP